MSVGTVTRIASSYIARLRSTLPLHYAKNSPCLYYLYYWNALLSGLLLQTIWQHQFYIIKTHWLLIKFGWYVNYKIQWPHPQPPQWPCSCYDPSHTLRLQGTCYLLRNMKATAKGRGFSNKATQLWEFIFFHCYFRFIYIYVCIYFLPVSGDVCLNTRTRTWRSK